MNSLMVRQAVLADLDNLVPLFDEYRQFYGRSSDNDAAREFLLARFNHSESVLFLAALNGKYVGFVQLYPSFSSVSLARIFILNDLYVSPEARNSGVAKRLLEAACEYASSLGAVRLTLSTSVTNETAQNLYRSAGWKRDELFHVFHFTLPQ